MFRPKRGAAAALALIIGCFFIAGCRQEEKPPANSGYYSGSDYSKGVKTPGAGGAPKTGRPGAVGAQSN